MGGRRDVDDEMELRDGGCERGDVRRDCEMSDVGQAARWGMREGLGRDGLENLTAVGEGHLADRDRLAVEVLPHVVGD